MTTIAHMQGVGGRRMLRLAREWVGGEVHAAALLRRRLVHRSRMYTARNVREIPADPRLPQAMLLALDGFGTLHLIGMGGSVLLGPRETVRRWPPGTVTVDVVEGRGWSRPLTITDDAGSLTVVAAYLGSAQKAALALIERATA
jgi:hypothetical protein